MYQRIWLFPHVLRPTSWPIRMRLGFLVLAGMASIALAISTLMFSTADALFVRQARADLQRHNDAVAHEIDNLTAQAASSLLIARNTPAFTRYFEADPDDQATRAAALTEIQQLVVYLQRTFAIDEICVIDASGAEVARGVQGELAGPEDLSDDEASNPFFAPTMALNDGEVYRSTEPYTSPDTHRWVVAHATPIVLPDGRHVGLLHFEIPLAWFADKLDDTSLPGASSFLLDREGHVLVHRDLPAVAPESEEEHEIAHDGSGFPHAFVWGPVGFRGMATEMLRTGGGTVSYQGETEPFEVVYQPVFSGHWIVAAELPHSVIYQPGAELLRNTLIIAAPLLAVAVLIMIWYASRLLAPLRRLSRALAAVGAGHLEQSAGIAGSDEIGELGTAFDSMANELRASLQRQAAAEAALMHQATHDPLTELPNRALLQDRLANIVASSAPDRTPFSLLLMDLDRFKEVNDTLGHQAGDQLLQEVARRLIGELRTCDLVARLGGDEFAVLLPDADILTAPAIATRLIEVLQAPVVLGRQHVAVGASVGIAVHPLHGQDADTLMRRADSAMYAAKRGRAGHALATVDHEQPAVERLTLIGALRTAIDTNQLVLHYQPIVDCATGATVAVEALVRWQHPTQGLLSPDHFIPLAEETGLIAPLSRWVLRAALWQVHTWQARGTRLRVAVNLSAHDVQDLTLPTRIADLLSETGVAADQLTLELTETALMADVDRALRVLQNVSDLGVRVAIDDFGTGYSSLSYVTSLPAHELKIDGRFIRELTPGSRVAAVVASTIDMAHSLGMKVVAEGVEDRRVLAFLQALRCDRVQGYAFGRPVTADLIKPVRHGIQLADDRAAA